MILSDRENNLTLKRDFWAAGACTAQCIAMIKEDQVSPSLVLAGTRAWVLLEWGLLDKHLIWGQAGLATWRTWRRESPWILVHCFT